MQSQQPAKPNPALKDLEPLIGDWRMELSNASFLPDPSETVSGPAAVEWLEDGAFLVLRQGTRLAPPSAIWLIGRDESDETYQISYFDDRGVSRIYTMSFRDGVWKIWREAPGFFQRFTGTLSDDGEMISGQWEASSNGKTWEHDFDLTYTKIG